MSGVPSEQLRLRFRAPEQLKLEAGVATSLILTGVSRRDGYVSDKRLSWLHLSDLHAGAAGQDWLWPTFKTVFLEDLKRLHQKVGSWQVVIFSGDLSQRGDKADYDRVTEALLDIWQVQQELGFKPALFAVPGNHDLSRPSPNDPTAVAMKAWWQEEAIRKDLLTNADSPYRLWLETAFSGFTRWKTEAAAAGLPFLDETLGLLPGDASATMETSCGKLGLVGLNSSWLQLAGGDYRGKLSVEPPQLLAVTDDHPDRWSRDHDVTLLITHHPADWLHKTALEAWRSEVDPAGRFDAHLFGHMHEPDVSSAANGGSQPRRSIQAASLFGLEKIDGKIQRINGYSAGALEPDGALRIWPRITVRQTSGNWKLVPDHTLDLDDGDDSFRLAAARSPVSVHPQARTDPVPAIIGEGGENRAETAKLLGSLRYHIPGKQAHSHVRRVEQRRASGALSDPKARAIWIASDWGAGSDGFIKAILEPKTPPLPIFNIDLADYASREDFLDKVKAELSVTFEQLCTQFAAQGPACLILDNCPTSTGSPLPGQRTSEEDVEELADAITAFCPDLRLVLRSRRAPLNPSLADVRLLPLDEADLRAYVLEHEDGGDQYGDADAIAAIFRNSDGIPARIDATLRALQIVSIDRLSSTNSDLVRIDAATEAPVALRKAIDDLAASDEPGRQRAYSLLKALVAFPQGETINRLHRFYGSMAVWPAHAQELVDAALVTTAAPIGVQVGGAADSDKLLIVPRPVREQVRSRLAKEEHAELTKAAAAIYFGSNWMTEGRLKQSVAKSFAQPNISPHETANANSIILRLLNEALDASDERSLEASLAIAKSYVDALMEGDHFRTVVSFVKEVLVLIPEGHESAIAFLTYYYGRAMRMSGKNSEAEEILSSVDISYLPSSMKQILLISQALARQRLGDSEGAVILAKRVIAAEKKSASSLHAKAILLEENPDATDEQFRTLERACRRNSADVVANNLALRRANRSETSREEADAALDEIIKSKDASDFYNRVRAIVRKVGLLNAADKPVSDRDKALLIDAYHFLFNERLPALFDSCHRALWDLFVREDDQDNLLRLFRHSSLIWRLRGGSDYEQIYLRRLAEHVHTLVTRDIRLVNKETAYFIVRAGAVLT